MQIMITVVAGVSCSLFLVTSSLVLVSASEIGEDCAFEGIPLHGKVKVVDSFPDLKVQIVQSFPDLKVRWVNSFADDCGEWREVDSFPDFKIQYVDSFPDVKIKIVDSFPGMP